MSPTQHPSVLSRTSSFLTTWCDGFWLCIWFGFAVGLAFSIPAAVMTWLLKATAGGILNPLIGFAGAAFVVIVSPFLVSKVFRELDFPGGRPRSKPTVPTTSDEASLIS